MKRKNQQINGLELMSKVAAYPAKRARGGAWFLILSFQKIGGRCRRRSGSHGSSHFYRILAGARQSCLLAIFIYTHFSCYTYTYISFLEWEYWRTSYLWAREALSARPATREVLSRAAAGLSSWGSADRSRCRTWSPCRVVWRPTVHRPRLELCVSIQHEIRELQMMKM